MKNLTSKIKAKLKHRRSIAKACRELDGLSDRCITDMGLSPHLVRLGKRGYPWR